MILMRKHKLEGPICRIGLLVLTHLPRNRLLSCGTAAAAAAAATDRDLSNNMILKILMKLQIFYTIFAIVQNIISKLL